MTADLPDLDLLLRPLRDVYPLAVDVIDSAAAEIRRLYPPMPDVTRLVLIDPASGRELGVLSSGQSWRAVDLPAGTTVAAVVSASCTLTFEFDGRLIRSESNPPYSIGGDGAGGRLNPWQGLTIGEHTLRVTPFDRPGGRAGRAVAVTFRVTGEEAVAVGTKPSTPASPSVGTKPTQPGDPAVGTKPSPPTSSGGDGFSNFPLAAGARQIYVRADGDDGNAGDSPGRPLRTIAKAMSLLRPGSGDRVMLFAGHRFDGPIGRWRTSGLPGQPAGVFAYDDGSAAAVGARPIIACRNANGVDIDAPGVHDVAFVGLHLTAADRDPNDSGFRITSQSNYGVQALFPTTSVRLEDCQIDHFAFNVSFVCAGHKGQHQDLVIRRCLLLDAWGPPTELYRGQGIYLERCKGVRIEQCVLDHNGWIENAPGVKPTQNIYRHGAYVNDAAMADVVFDGCLVSRNANYGVQLRAGGVVRRCLLVDNATSVGIGGESGEVAGNLIFGGHDTDQYGQGIAIECFSRRATIAGNVILDFEGRDHPYPASRLHVSRRPWTPAGPRTICIEDNAIWGSEGPGLRIDDAISELIWRNNDLQRVRRALIAMDQPVARYITSGNTYGTHGPAGAATPPVTFMHHRQKGQLLPLSTWTELTGDTTPVQTPPVVNGGWRLDVKAIDRGRSRRRGLWSDREAPTSMIDLACGAFRRRG